VGCPKHLDPIPADPIPADPSHYPHPFPNSGSFGRGDSAGSGWASLLGLVFLWGLDSERPGAWPEGAWGTEDQEKGDDWISPPHLTLPPPPLHLAVTSHPDDPFGCFALQFFAQQNPQFQKCRNGGGPRPLTFFSHPCCTPSHQTKLIARPGRHWQKGG
jgi:hypothetical protein